MTTYNQAPYIVATIRSVLAQTSPAEEVIVVDDGSTDDTAARLRPFGDHISYLRSANQGVAAARNAGVARASGHLVAFLDGDDLWEPGKLGIQVAAALAHPEAGLIAVDGMSFSHAGVASPTVFARRARQLLDESGDRRVILDAYRMFLYENIIWTTSQVMIPAPVLETVGPSDPAFSLASDYDLYLRIAQRYPTVLVGDRLTQWRYLPTSASGPRERRSLRWGLDDVAIWTKHLRHASSLDRPHIRKRISRKSRTLAREAYYLGREDRGFAIRCLRRLIRVRASRGSLEPVAFLIALWCPPRVATSAARALRGVRLFRSPSP